MEQARFEEAQPVLLEGFERLSNSIGAGELRDDVRRAIERVVGHLVTWRESDPSGGHFADAAEWRGLLGGE